MTLKVVFCLRHPTLWKGLVVMSDFVVLLNQQLLSQWIIDACADHDVVHIHSVISLAFFLGVHDNSNTPSPSINFILHGLCQWLVVKDAVIIVNSLTLEMQYFPLPACCRCTVLFECSWSVWFYVLHDCWRKSDGSMKAQKSESSVMSTFLVL